MNYILSLTPMDYLKYKQSETENMMLLYYLKTFNMLIVNDSYSVILKVGTSRLCQHNFEHNR